MQVEMVLVLFSFVCLSILNVTSAAVLPEDLHNVTQNGSRFAGRPESSDYNRDSAKDQVNFRSSKQAFDTADTGKSDKDSGFQRQKKRRVKARESVISNVTDVGQEHQGFPTLTYGAGRACPVESADANVSLSSLGIGGWEWKWIGEAAVAIAIIKAIVWIKAIIIAVIAWWWYGAKFGEEKGQQDQGGYAYGPPAPAYGTPVQQTYGAPTSGYGRRLVNSIDWNKMTDKVWNAIDFFEKYYNSGESKKVT